MASLMSLTYNMNRGKGKQMSVSDFFPFDEEIGDDELSSAQDVEDLASSVEQLRSQMVNATKNNG